MSPDARSWSSRATTTMRCSSRWLERRANCRRRRRSASSSAVDWRPTRAPLDDGAARRVGGPRALRSAYPGVWLREDVYATHGHYGDRHNTMPILERLGAGRWGASSARPRAARRAPRTTRRRWRRCTRGSTRSPRAAGRPDRGPRRHFHDRALAGADGGHDGSAARRSCAAARWRGLPGGVAALNRAGIGPLRRRRVRRRAPPRRAARDRRGGSRASAWRRRTSSSATRTAPGRCRRRPAEWRGRAARADQHRLLGLRAGFLRRRPARVPTGRDSRDRRGRRSAELGDWLEHLVRSPG